MSNFTASATTVNSLNKETLGNKIRKCQRKDQYTRIFNQPINDINISAEALALLVYLMSKPDDWDVQVGDIKNRFNFGRDKIRKIFNELSELGYVKRCQNHVNGRLTHTTTYVSDEPIYINFEHPNINEFDELQGPENQCAENQSPEKTSLSKEIGKQKKEKQKTPIVPLKGDVRVIEVFEYWQIVMNHPKANLCDKRTRIIKKALKDYSLEDLKKAIDGCKLDPWHMGIGNKGKKNDEISLICRDSIHIEKFIESADKPKPKSLMTPIEQMQEMSRGAI